MAAKKRERGHQETGKSPRTELASQPMKPVVVAKIGESVPRPAESSREHERPEVAAKAGAEGTNPSNPSPEQEKKRLSMAAQGMTEESAQSDFRGFARAWKDGYLQGLNTCLRWQEENERLVKDSVKQGFSATQQFLTWWKDRIEEHAQRQEGAKEPVNGPIPILEITKQSTGAALATIQPILNNSEALMDGSFGYYEQAVAIPSRKYVRDFNRQVLDVVIPS